MSGIVQTLPVPSKPVRAAKSAPKAKPERKGKPKPAEAAFVSHVVHMAESDREIVFTIDGKTARVNKKLADETAKALELGGKAERFYRDNATALVETFTPACLERDTDERKLLRKFLESRSANLVGAQGELAKWNIKHANTPRADLSRKDSAERASILDDIQVYSQVITNAINRIRKYYEAELKAEAAATGGDKETRGKRTMSSVPQMIDDFAKKMQRIADAKMSGRSATEQEMARNAVAALRMVKTGEIAKVFAIMTEQHAAEVARMQATTAHVTGLQAPTAAPTEQPQEPQRAAA